MQLDFSLPSTRLRTLRTGAVVVSDSATVLRIEGTGALTCLQGLLTCDLAASGDGGLAYGALLTSKGMVIFDAWVFREQDAFTLVAEASARGPALELFRRTLPPRLARVIDLTEQARAAWLLGATAPERLARALAEPVPGAGRAIRAGSLLLAGGTAVAPFASLAVGPQEAIALLLTKFQNAGGTIGCDTDLAGARIVAGWPTLGREIDDKTLPQEVRFDDLGGISYTKGCYTGQETVARLHFRGHVNRSLRGLIFDGPEPPAERTLTVAGKDVGNVRSALGLDDRVIALAMVRREVGDGAVLMAGPRRVVATALPFDAGPIAA
jgi:folate-binding protein YgfZ